MARREPQFNIDTSMQLIAVAENQFGLFETFLHPAIKSLRDNHICRIRKEYSQGYADHYSGAIHILREERAFNEVLSYGWLVYRKKGEKIHEYSNENKGLRATEDGWCWEGHIAGDDKALAAQPIYNLESGLNLDFSVTRDNMDEKLKKAQELSKKGLIPRIVPRPLTLAEHIYEYVEYAKTKSGEEWQKLKLLADGNFDTCTGFAYQEGTGNFKVVPMSKELISISRDYHTYPNWNRGLPIDYNNISGTEFNITQIPQDGFSYEELITHELWREILPDASLRVEFADFMYLLKIGIFGAFTKELPEKRVIPRFPKKIEFDQIHQVSIGFPHEGTYLIAKFNNARGSSILGLNAVLEFD